MHESNEVNNKAAISTNIINCFSDVPIIQQADSLPEVFSNLLVDPNLAPSMNFNDLDFNLDDALTDWSNDMLLSGSDLSPLGPPSSQEVSHSPSVASEAGQPRIEDVSSIFNNEVADNEIICYGMVSHYNFCQKSTSASNVRGAVYL